VRAARRRIAIACEAEPVLWAHVHRFHHGLSLLHAARRESWSVVPPIRGSAIARIGEAMNRDAWWSRYGFVKTMYSPSFTVVVVVVPPSELELTESSVAKTVSWDPWTQNADAPTPPLLSVITTLVPSIL
jgi:hypothetical protein